MKTRIALVLFAIMITSIFIFSCQKESTNQEENGLMEINFSLSNLKSSKTTQSDTISSSTLKYIVVSVEDNNGKLVKSSEKVELYNMNGNYISKPLSLPKGSYKLTSFLVLDGNNNVVYVSPLKGSPKAYLVSNPLPLTFTVQTNIVTKVIPEVLNASGSKPEDFGYTTFNFNIAQTFDFLVGTFIYDDTIKNYKLTSSTIAISTDTIPAYSGSLNVNPSSVLVSKYDSLGVTNKITLPERFNKYTLVISKPGYKTFTQTFTKEELKLHFRSADKGPLVILLEKAPITLSTGLVAYYKFNGDVLDYSGYNNNGTYYGRGLYTLGYNGDVNSSIDLNGSSDYVYVKNSPSLSPVAQISICAWYYSVPFYGNGANTIVCKENTIFPPASLYHLAVEGDSYVGTPIFLFNTTTENGAKPIHTRGIFHYEMNKWYFVVGIYDGNNNKLYVNGTLIVSTPQKGNLLNRTNNIYIGNSEGLSRPEYDYTPGRIDEIRIYNRALSDAEILSLYQQ